MMNYGGEIAIEEIEVHSDRDALNLLFEPGLHGCRVIGAKGFALFRQSPCGSG
jgi:hypothetical protein